MSQKLIHSKKVFKDLFNGLTEHEVEELKLVREEFKKEIEDELKIELASKLKMARSKAGLTQRQVAQFMNVDFSYISKIESGKRLISLNTLSRYINAIGGELEITVK